MHMLLWGRERSVGGDPPLMASDEPKPDMENSSSTAAVHGWRERLALEAELTARTWGQEALRSYKVKLTTEP